MGNSVFSSDQRSPISSIKSIKPWAGLLFGVRPLCPWEMCTPIIFGPIRTVKAFYASALVVMLVAALAAGHIFTHAVLLGWPLIAWASLLALLYLWVCIVYRDLGRLRWGDAG